MFATISVAALGLAIALFATWKRSKGDRRIRGRIWEIVRDIALAFSIAALVTIAFEFSVRVEHLLGRFQQVLSNVMTKMVPETVWEQVRSSAIERKMTRTSFRVTVHSLRSIPDLPDWQREFCLSVDFAVGALQSEATDETLTQGLDWQFSNAKANLPRFESLNVAGKEYSWNELRTRFRQGGAFRIPIRLPPRSSPPIQVLSKRCEVVTVPGAYFLVMSDVTQGADVVVEPEGLRVEVHFTPDRPNVHVDQMGRKTAPGHWHYPLALLVGQAIEMRFSRIGESAQ